jgi:putative sterol carrier protein
LASSTATSQFFDHLRLAERQPSLAKAKGTARFDITDAGSVEHWLLTIDDGEVLVSREDADADAIITSSRDTFDELVRGRANMMAALLREDVTASGDPKLLVRVQRLFPRPTS